MTDRYSIMAPEGIVGYGTVEKQGAQYLIRCELRSGKGEVVLRADSETVSLGKGYPDGTVWRLAKRVKASLLDGRSVCLMLETSQENEIVPTEMTFNISHLRRARFLRGENRVIIDAHQISSNSTGQ